MKISIIIATYHSFKTLKKAILSVLKQTYGNFELIIIDGGSTDGTLDIIEEYKDQIYYYCSETDNGIYDAWNKGLAKANGEWISFLGADDTFLPNALMDYVDGIKNSKVKNLQYISSEVELVNKNGKAFRTVGEKWQWERFKIFMNVAHVGSLHHHSLYEKYGKYNVSYKIIGDYELLLRAKDTLNADYVDKITVKMQMGGVSNQNTQVFVEQYKAKLALSIRTPLQAKKDFIIAKTKFYLRNLLNNLS